MLVETISVSHNSFSLIWIIKIQKKNKKWCSYYSFPPFLGSVISGITQNAAKDEDWSACRQKFLISTDCQRPQLQLQALLDKYD